MKRGIGLAIAMSACISAAACAAPAGPPVSASTQALAAKDFWGVHQVPALEVDPASSLSELETRAARIVVGRIVQSQAGPDNPVTLDDGTVDLNDTTVLTVAVNDTLKGSPVSRVKVWISQANTNANGLAASQLPADDHVWFLTPSERPGLDHLVSQTGVVGPWTSDAPATVLDPGLTQDIVPSDVDDVPGLARLIADH